MKKLTFFTGIKTAKNNTTFELESLILEVWTNGGLMPDEALSLSAEILENTFNQLKVTNITTTLSPDIETSIQEKNLKNFATIYIEELELSIRAYNCLKRANIHTLGDLLKYEKDELLEFKNFGRKSADEVCENLIKRFNITLT
jgi:DNA-directed RNA polymerase subunit alpha